MDDLRLGTLGLLLEIERMARRAETLPSLRYVIVNETNSLVPYRQAALWEPGFEGLSALSGVSLPDSNAPFVVWLKRLMASLRRKAGNLMPEKGLPPFRVTAADVEDAVAADWGDWLPEHALALPLAARDGTLGALLLLARPEPFRDEELALLFQLAEAYGHALDGLKPKRRLRIPERLSLDRKKLTYLIAALLVVSLFPVRISVLAPAEVAARDPWVLRAPIDGIVQSIDVLPNKVVKSGEVLVRFERQNLENQLAVSRQNRLVAEAEYRRAAQQSIFDRSSMSEMSVLRSKVATLRTEEDYAFDQLDRTVIRAERSGVAVYADPEEWAGRPVKTGERILTITDPKRVKLDIWLAVEDAVAFDNGAEVVFFLSSNPLKAVHSRLVYASYTPEARPDGTLVYNLEASFSDQRELPRVGLKGTAKVYGQRVPLVYYIFRRPVAALRRWVGV
ncbi:MAG: HlyD family efflux transporter periplasmic adaptor subunit [Chlorobiaceae bacterium]|nr:HlyD family efflux transporter periplasmic adaptor subunit [Chlorobiaceae bacterium]